MPLYLAPALPERPSRTGPTAAETPTPKKHESLKDFPGNLQIDTIALPIFTFDRVWIVTAPGYCLTHRSFIPNEH